MVTWLTVSEARSGPYWPGENGDPYDDDAVRVLLASAQEQCEAFAPTLPADTVSVPERYRLAVSLQARDLYRAGLVGGADQIGADGFAVQIFPMSLHVKALLRPSRGKPVVK